MLGKTRLHMCTINDNYMMYGSWYMERDGQNCLSFWTVFCPFTALTTKNPDHMQYCSWDTMRDGCNSNLFWAIFCPFISLTVQKITIKKKMKETPGDVIILQQCSKNHDHMLYCSRDMARDRCNYFLFWAIFCPFTPLTAQKIKILKKCRKHLETSLFYLCAPKIMIRWYTVPEIWCTTNGRKWHIELGAPPKKYSIHRFAE